MKTDILCVCQGVLCFTHPKVMLASLIFLLWQHNVYSSAACAQVDPLRSRTQNYFLNSHSPFWFCTVEHICVSVASST